MKDEQKSKAQLIAELQTLRQQTARLETLLVECGRTEAALRESEYRYRQAVENSPNPIFSVDTEGIIQTWNRACEKTFHYNQSIVGQPYQLLLRNDDKAAVQTMLDTVHISQSLSDIDIVYRNDDGEERFMVSRIYPLRDKKDKISGYVFANTDISERVRAEVIFKESGNRASALLIAISDIMFRLDDHGIFLDYRIAQSDHYAQPEETFIDKNIRDIMPPEVADLVKRKIRHTLDSGEIHIFEYQLPISGRGLVDYEARMVKSGVDEVIAIVRDVTERKQTEEKLQILSVATEQSPVSVVITNIEGNIEYVNPQFYKLTGYSAEEVTGKNVRMLQSGKLPDALFKQLWMTIFAGKIWRGELHNKKKNGEFYWEEAVISPIFDGNGDIVRFLAMKEDITERKRTEAALQKTYEELELRVQKRTIALKKEIEQHRRTETALRQSEEKFRTLAEQSPNIIFINVSGRVVYTNEKGIAVTGYTKAEFYSPNFNYLDLVAPESMEVIRTSFRKHQKGEDVRSYECSLIAKDGKRINTIITSRLITYEGKQAVLGIVTDITGRVQMEQVLRKNEARYRTLLADSQRKALELSLLNTVRIALASELDLSLLFRTVVEAISNTFGYTLVSIYLIDGDVLKLQHQTGYHRVLEEIMTTQGVMGQVVRNGKPVLLEDVHTNAVFLEAIEGIVSEVCVPLFDEGRVTGVLNVESVARITLHEADLQLVTAISEHINVAIGRARLYAQIRESEERYRSLYNMFCLMADNMPDMLWAKDMEGCFLFTNRSLCDNLLLARDTDEPIGKKDMFFVNRARQLHPDDPAWHTFGEVCTDSDAVVTATRRPERFDEFGNVKGQFLYLDVYKAPIWNGQREMVGTVGCGRIVTREKQVEQELRESEERYRTLANDSPIAIVVHSKGEIVYVNVATLKLMGASAEADLLGKPIMECVHPNYHDIVKERVQKLYEKDDTASPMEEKFIRLDGKVIDVEVTGKAINFDGQPASQVIISDITERKKAEKTLKIRTEQLALLNRAGRAVAASLDLNEVLATVLEQVHQLIGITTSSIWLIDTKEYNLVSLAVAMPEAYITRGECQSVAQNLVGWVIQHKDILNIPDIRVDNHHFNQTDEQSELKVRSIFCLPLLAKDKVLGVLTLVDETENRFSPNDVHLAESLAALAAIAIENARLYRQTRQDAQTKTILLQEVNHRVKNNLTAITGMLHIEQQHVEQFGRERTYPEIIDDLTNRINGLLTVHQLLSAANWSPLPLTKLTRQVIKAVTATQSQGRQVLVDISSTAPVTVTPKEAHNLAIIINELITNVIKYVVPTQKTTQLTVHIALSQDERSILFKFQDDGPGFPTAVLQSEYRNVGLYLIENSVRHSLRGEVTFHNDRGAVVAIQFDKETNGSG